MTTTAITIAMTTKQPMMINAMMTALNPTVELGQGLPTWQFLFIWVEVVLTMMVSAANERLFCVVLAPPKRRDTAVIPIIFSMAATNSFDFLPAVATPASANATVA